ncbi:hypothetical protein [Brucella anthropi]|uniref:hypothetical protein n=1 Tax=Brucella anthropi TaxID=529 RepID=UPI0005BE6870|nr:hypothetical protein [Brucella anthropi]KIU70147.1 hypothetical protein TR92_02370 [Brucella anthropi]
MNVFSYPMMYVFLRDSEGRPLFLRDLFATLFISTLISIPFILSGANYFGDRGFLDRFGSFCAVLTGFYIAALVGVATLSSSVGDVDTPIEVGKITFRENDGDERELTRREYVCAIFAYLSFLSLLLSLLSITFIVIAPPIALHLPIIFDYLAIPSFIASKLTPSLVILFMALIISQMIVTTFHGLYYFIDRLYYKKAVLSDEEPDDTAP